MDTVVLKNFLNERLSTKQDVKEAADAVGVSIATLYRYKADPSLMGLGTFNALSSHLGLPMQEGAIWLKDDIIGGERRRLSLEKAVAEVHGTRFTTTSPYTVNVELSDITKQLLLYYYGTKAPQIEDTVLSIRDERKRLYDEYETWEIWSAHGYKDFFHGKRRFKSISEKLRQAQIEEFIESSYNPKRHRFMADSTELPIFSCFMPVNVVLVRIDDIYIESRSPEIVESFKETFNDLVLSCMTKNIEQFVDFLKNPAI